MLDPVELYIAVIVTVAELTIIAFVLAIRREQKRLEPLAPILDMVSELTPVEIQALQSWGVGWIRGRVEYEAEMARRGHGPSP